MRSRSALAPRVDAPREKRVSAPVARAQSTLPVQAAANDDKPTAGFSVYGDPLFGMAIASVILFAILAALMALS